MFLKIFLLVLFVIYAAGLVNLGEKREEASAPAKAIASIIIIGILTLLAYFILT